MGKDIESDSLHHYNMIPHNRCQKKHAWYFFFKLITKNKGGCQKSSGKMNDLGQAYIFTQFLKIQQQMDLFGLHMTF